MFGASEIDRGRAEQLLSLVVDPIWYRARYRDVGGIDPLRHFIEAGLRERRDPNRWFDGAWYTRRYADVAASGMHPLLHYMSEGAKGSRDPHPRFDAAWYVEQHPDAAGNPMLFHLRVGARRGWLTERPVVIENYLPATRIVADAPSDAAVDVIIPAYRDLELTRRCLNSVLADPARPPGRIIVIDDHSPEPALSAWLRDQGECGAITLIRNKTNRGFVASVNLGIRRAGDHDVVLLNSDTEVPSGWLARLRGQALAAPNVASVSPLSNNATVCSYLGFEGGPMPPGVTLRAIDAACQSANAGRFVDTPTTVGFCMYIRRAALDAVGLFDTKTFGKGYGEENDFCLRAAALGWVHHIACDTFVRHEGGASFGAAADQGITRAYGILTRRYPDYAFRIARYVQADETAPFRFAATMALFRASGLPAILDISHEFDGGVRRHVNDLIEQDAGRAHHLVLEPASRGVALSVPALRGHPKLILAAERWRDVAAVVRSAGVTRVHIHHLMGVDLDVRALIHELGCGFDVTLHDYFAICPQVTLLPWSAGDWCGEPPPSDCDACIAHRPSHGATDIVAWRSHWAWQFHEADRVFVPSRDALERLGRYGLAAKAVKLPHETVPPGRWPLRPPARVGKRLRVAVLGVLANHKGAHTVASVALAGNDAPEILLIGTTEPGFPEAARKRMTITGAYRDAELPELLAKYLPDVVWFPACWPETYSFTLSAAIETGLPIVASAIGAFPERLASRPLTWLVPPTKDPAAWLLVFEAVAAASRAHQPVPVATRPPTTAEIPPAPARRSGLIDPRRAGTTSVVVVPETFDDGSLTPCAYIRLLLPLDHPTSGVGMIPTIADPAAAMRYRADVIITQRHALPDIAAADALAAHAKRTGARLVYDLDDDLLTIPPNHPEAAHLAPLTVTVERMIRLADTVRVSTETLARRVESLARRVVVAGNALDERLWVPISRERDNPYGPVRILCMGTSTHDDDFALILPALREIHRDFGEQVRVDLIGFTSRADLPVWIRRPAPSPHAGRSYPGFVHWLRGAAPWDIGLAPLAATDFNAHKSAIKALDYAALGLATLASDVPAYRGSPADGAGGMLVANTDTAWYEALSWLIRATAERRGLAARGAALFRSTGTLENRPDTWNDLSTPERKRAPGRTPRPRPTVRRT